MSKKPQEQLEIIPVTHQVIDGLEMGVLGDGTPYLTARALARLCDVAPSVIITLGLRWAEERHKPRGRKIQGILSQQGYDGEEIVIKTNANAGEVSAHPDAVCMAILEYYAFDKGNAIALQAYRLLARQSLKLFIYGRLGYDPDNQIPKSWRDFHARMTINNSPTGFFSVFREISDILVSALQHGMVIDSSVMPDISVGQAWAKHWSSQELSNSFGERKKHPHHFPESFPQTDQDVWVYPIQALGDFRLWLQRSYLPGKFPGYIKRKASQGALPVSQVELLLGAITTAELPEG
tara:strand:- start:12772 stop:13650 length:879 start_codon:yes stop_codon:yes gene_type:complete